MPRRALAPGLHMGLSVTLNAQVEESYCSTYQSSGLILVLSVFFVYINKIKALRDSYMFLSHNPRW